MKDYTKLTDATLALLNKINKEVAANQIETFICVILNTVSALHQKVTKIVFTGNSVNREPVVKAWYLMLTEHKVSTMFYTDYIGSMREHICIIRTSLDTWEKPSKVVHVNCNDFSVELKNEKD